MIKPIPIDISNTPIQGSLSGIPKVQIMTTHAGSWHPVILEYEECKQIALQSRGIIDWYFSTSSGGDYYTLRNGASLEAPVVAVSGTLLCWVSCSEDMVFEMLIGR